MEKHFAVLLLLVIIEIARKILLIMGKKLSLMMKELNLNVKLFHTDSSHQMQKSGFKISKIIMKKVNQLLINIL